MSKIQFSKIIAGTMSWGTWGKNFNPSEMESMIHHCMENDITSFDHADIYGDYTTEEEFGKALKNASIDRTSIQLISKCGIQLISEKRNTYVKHYDYSPTHIINSVENSLKNLHTDYLDLLLLHRPSPLMNADLISETIKELKDSGKIREFGVSNFTPSQTQHLLSHIPVQYNQIEFSLTHHEAMLNGSLDFMQAHHIKPMCWSPLGNVFRDKKFAKLLTKIADLAKKYQTSADVILLAWIIKHPAAIIPVVGTSNKHRITNLKNAFNLDLELQEWFQILEIASGNGVP